MSPTPDLHDEMDADPTLDRLRSVASVADPVPELVMESARAAFSLRRIDAEIAELLHDSAVDADLVLVRGPSDARMLSFAVGEVAVEMQLTETQPGFFSLLAFVTGASGEVKVEHSGGVLVAVLDDAGRLLVDDIPAGRLRLDLVADDGTAVTTSWITA
jgi:hypothetical protein